MDNDQKSRAYAKKRRAQPLRNDLKNIRPRIIRSGLADALERSRGQAQTNGTQVKDTQNGVFQLRSSTNRKQPRQDLNAPNNEIKCSFVNRFLKA